MIDVLLGNHLSKKRWFFLILPDLCFFVMLVCILMDFWNEASILADLHHPNVVALYGVVHNLAAALH